MILLATTLALSAAQPAPACSGYPPSLLQAAADVVVAGRTAWEGAKPYRMIVSRRVLKGEKKTRYRVVWPAIDDKDECKFLLPLPRDRGVYFLTRRSDGDYDVLWAGDRWKMVR